MCKVSRKFLGIRTSEKTVYTETKYSEFHDMSVGMFKCVKRECVVNRETCRASLPVTTVILVEHLFFGVEVHHCRFGRRESGRFLVEEDVVTDRH